MYKFLFAAVASLATNSLLHAQQCDLIFDDFNATVGTLPVTSAPGWNEVGGPGALISSGPIDGQCVVLQTASTGSASRTLESTATGHFGMSFEMRTTDALATMTLPTQGGSALSRIVVGTLTGYPSDYAVTSLDTDDEVLVPIGQTVKIEYRIDTGDSYSVLVNDIWFLVDQPWTPGASALMGDPTVGTLPAPADPTVGTLPIVAPPGVTFLDNFCMGQNIGQAYCAVNANSTGVPAAISAAGSESVAENAVVLRMESLPANNFGYFLVSQGQGFVANPGGSQGNLCIGGAPIGRYIGPGQVQNSGSQGVITLAIDLSDTPQPGGAVAIGAGETWNFQGYYRDFDPAAGGIVTNWTEGLEIQFQ